MPIEKTERTSTRVWGLWKVTETENQLAEMLDSNSFPAESISNSQKRMEWFGGRILTQYLLKLFEIDFKGIVKNEHGKPFLVNSHFHISLSHSFPYIAAVIDKEKEVGIDLEQPKEKLLRVAPRVLSPSESGDAGRDIVKHCVYWCAKEALIKIHGKKDLTLAENIAILPFSVHSEGHILGKLIVTDNETLIPLYYRVFPDFVIVLTE